MLIYLLRHGETEYNAEGRYQGIRDVPLSAQGRAALCRAEISPGTVYVSPLSRARETARILFPGARQIPVEGLEEMRFGVFEGRNYREMEHDPAYRAWVDGNCLGRCPGGESRADFSERVCRAFAGLVEAARRAGETQLVIVAHGGTQMAALERYAEPARDYYDWRAKPGEGFVLSDGRWDRMCKLDFMGEVCYNRRSK